MAAVLLTPETRDEIVNRFMKISEDTRPQWGSMDAKKMIRHMRYSFDVSNGDEKVEDKSNLFYRTAVKYIFFYAYTNWPKGKLKAPDTHTPEPKESFDEERHLLIKSIDRYLHNLKSSPQHRQVSELLGPITLTEWSRVHGVHTDHHLRQFGV